MNNRYQKESDVAELMKEAKEIGFETINVDMLYGLLGDNRKRFIISFDKIIKMNPGKISLYFLQSTKQYLHICNMGKEEFLIKRREMIKSSMNDIRFIAQENDYLFSSALSATEGESGGMISFRKKRKGFGKEFLSKNDQAFSVFGIGQHASSSIEKKLIYRMNQSLETGSDEYSFSGRMSDKEKEILTYIYASLNFSKSISFLRFEKNFEVEFKEKFPKEISKLEGLKVIKVLKEKMIFKAKEDWLPYFLFFVGKDKVSLVKTSYEKRD
ncbi:MAG: hypothetical protein WBK67_04375 [Minisyncoccales bacterium]